MYNWLSTFHKNLYLAPSRIDLEKKIFLKQKRMALSGILYSTNGHKYTTARPIAAQFPVHGYIYDLTTVRSFDSQAT